MLRKTKGLIIRAIKYSESSLIMDVYTEDYGLMSFIVSGARKPRSRMPASLFQLMNWVEVVAYIKENGSLCRIKEARPVYHYQNIPFEIEKRSVGMFITEIIQKTVKEHEPNLSLYTFLQDTFYGLDQTTARVSNYHILFMLELSKYLGFYPHGQCSDSTPYFDLLKGTFVQLAHPAYTIDKTRSHALSQALASTIATSHDLALTRKQRQFMIEDLLVFYKLHMDRMGEVQTHKILIDILS